MTAVQPRGRRSPAGSQADTGPQEEVEEELIYMQCCGQEDPVRENQAQHQAQAQGPACQQVYPATAASSGAWPSSSALTCAGSSNSFRSPESVEMDEIMAAMVLTSLSCSPMMHSGAPQKDLLPACSSSGDMECGGGELSDSGSSGYWSWDHGSVSPAPSPSVTEVDGSLSQSGDQGTEMDGCPSQSPDEGLHMELDMGEGRRHKGCGRGAYRCLWPGCSKVLNSRVAMKRHIHLQHLGGESEHSQCEEDFYYTEVSSEEEPSPPSPAASPSPSPSQSPSLGPTTTPTSTSSSSSRGVWASSSTSSTTPTSTSSSRGVWASSSSSSSSTSSSSSSTGVWAPCCSSSGSSTPGPQASSSGSSTLGPQASSSAYCYSSPLSQSAPSSVWQIHTEHLYQACAPVQVTVSSGSSSPPSYWAPAGDAHGQGHSLHTHTQVLSSRSRSVSVGEQWLQRNSAPSRTHTISASPSRNHCTFRKGRGEAKKCRKVYGVELRAQWCTACRWKKACQRFPD
ncbi:zinc finger protein 395b isoform X3 [Engraulis encrasicolus]|uniref:zinc finger protein 395b isoform X2 n=1 Tax=Engraulis encrasicolus TaxID=184585 RepID=UPI002FD51E79